MHIVLVTAASVRQDYVLTADGGVDSSLPELSSLAADSTVFDRAYASCPDDESTLRSILTGTHPDGTPERGPTLVDRLSEAGWETGLFRGTPDERRQTDRQFETPEVDEDAGTVGRIRRAVGRKIREETAVGRPLESIDQLLGSTLGVRVGASRSLPAETVTERALSWLDETSGPRFLWVHYDDTRAPHVPREGTVSESVSPRTATKLSNGGASAAEGLTDEERATLDTLYRGELQRLDRCLGRLFDGVRSRLGDEETVTAFAGTSGCPLGGTESRHGAPDAFSDESIRVPLFVHGPEFDAETVEFGASSVDVLPTLLAAAGVESGDRCDGTKLQSFLGRRVTERQVFAVDGGSPSAAMVCNGRWKLVRSLRDGREALFDYASEPACDRSSEKLPVQRALTHALDYFVENRRQASDAANRTRQLASR